MPVEKFEVGKRYIAHEAPENPGGSPMFVESMKPFLGTPQTCQSLVEGDGRLTDRWRWHPSWVDLYVEAGDTVTTTEGVLGQVAPFPKAAITLLLNEVDDAQLGAIARKMWSSGEWV